MTSQTIVVWSVLKTDNRFWEKNDFNITNHNTYVGWVISSTTIMQWLVYHEQLSNCCTKNAVDRVIFELSQQEHITPCHPVIAACKYRNYLTPFENHQQLQFKSYRKKYQKVITLQHNKLQHTVCSLCRSTTLSISMSFSFVLFLKFWYHLRIHTPFFTHTLIFLLYKSVHMKHRILNKGCLQLHPQHGLSHGMPQNYWWSTWQELCCAQTVLLRILLKWIFLTIMDS